MESFSFMRALVTFLVLLQFQSYIKPSSATKVIPCKTSNKFIRKSCSATRHPKLCYNSLSIYAAKNETSPKLLAQAALNVSMAYAKSTEIMMNKLWETKRVNAYEISIILELTASLEIDLKMSLFELIDINISKASNHELKLGKVEKRVVGANTVCRSVITLSQKIKNRRVKAIVKRRYVNLLGLIENSVDLIKCSNGGASKHHHA